MNTRRRRKKTIYGELYTASSRRPFGFGNSNKDDVTSRTIRAIRGNTQCHTAAFKDACCSRVSLKALRGYFASGTKDRHIKLIRSYLDLKPYDS